jgi:hypothetical protein
MHDNLDENDILRDGQRLRVPMMMRDHLTPLQRAVLDHNTVVVDDCGDTALNRPGYRFIRGMDRTAVHEAFDQYCRDTAEAWQGRDADTGRYPLSAGEGSACTINGAPGTLQRESDYLVCRPTAATPGDADPRAAAYRDYCDRLTNAWRRTP